MADAHDPYAALRWPNFCLLLSSNVLAALSAEVQLTVVEWEIYCPRSKEQTLLDVRGSVV